MELKINNKLIIEPIENILITIQNEISNGKLKHIKRKDASNILITCPSHKDGKENHPSCSIYTRRDDKEVCYGTAHCFSCGYSAPLHQVVADCFDEDIEFGKEWLLERFGNVFIETVDILPEITFENEPEQYLSEKILDEFEYYHNYMFQRKLTKEIIDKFRIGFDIKRNAITFPVWDEFNKLKMITARAVDNKKFYIDKEVSKPVYLLNFCSKSAYPFVIITEAQIDALTAWSYGVPSCAFIGLGSKQQYDIINKSSVRSWVTMFDNDEAGMKATNYFNKSIRKDVFVTNITLPFNKKDINDLSKQEFDDLLNSYGLTWRLN